ncbi:MAG: baseplate assembly protein W, partial [Pseudomonadota bacterium]
IDQPVTPGFFVRVYARVAEALRWEPELDLRKVRVVKVEAGALTIEISGIWKPGGQHVTVDGIRYASH